MHISPVQSINMKRSIFFSSLVVLVAISQVAQAYLPHPEALRLCRLRTGLKDGDIKQHHTRNQK